MILGLLSLVTLQETLQLRPRLVVRAVANSTWYLMSALTVLTEKSWVEDLMQLSWNAAKILETLTQEKTVATQLVNWPLLINSSVC